MYSDSGSQTFPHPETTDLSMPQDNKKKRKRHSFDDTLLISAVNDQMLLETKRPKPDLDALQTNSLAPPASNLATFGPCPHSPRKSTSKKAYSRLSTTAVSEPRRRCSGASCFFCPHIYTSKRLYARKPLSVALIFFLLKAQFSAFYLTLAVASSFHPGLPYLET
jgi:hypothetical protein